MSTYDCIEALERKREKAEEAKRLSNASSSTRAPEPQLDAYFIMPENHRSWPLNVPEMARPQRAFAVRSQRVWV